MSEQDFDEILRKAVIEGFTSLGDPSKRALDHYLLTQCGIETADIPHRIKDFESAIADLFGQGGRYLEDIILVNLYAAVGYDSPLPSRGRRMSFEKRIQRAADFYRSRSGSSSTNDP